MSAEKGAEQGGAGVFGVIKGLSAALLGIVRTRLELLTIEIAEERIRLSSLVVKVVGALFLLGLGVVFTIATLVLAFWEQRLLLVGFCALLTVFGGLLMLGQCLAVLRRPSALFRSSLAELDKDLDRLRQRQSGP